MDNTYYVVSNGTHVTVIKDSDILIADIDDNSQSELHQAALDRAKAKFETAGIDAGNLTIAGEVNEDTDVDNVSDFGVPEQAVVDYARNMFVSDNDPDVDEDALVSGNNAQCWAYVDSSDLFESLATGAPVPIKRSKVDREERLRQELKVKIAKIASTLAVELAAAGVATSARMVAFMSQVDAVFDGDTTQPATNPGLCASIRTWEVGEGSDEDLTEQQRKPWDLSFKMMGDQGELILKPEGMAEEDALDGYRVLVEINKGYPALHISPTPAGDVGVIVHAISRHELEVTPNNPHCGVDVSSKIYKTPAIVYSNGDTGYDPRGINAA